MASSPGRLESSLVSLWEPHIAHWSKMFCALNTSDISVQVYRHDNRFSVWLMRGIHSCTRFGKLWRQDLVVVLRHCWSLLLAFHLPFRINKSHLVFCMSLWVSKGQGLSKPTCSFGITGLPWPVIVLSIGISFAVDMGKLEGKDCVNLRQQCW
jgi:hypothetical protein